MTTNATCNVSELVEIVKAHALSHYEDGGWDVIVECWSDREIAEEIGRARTAKGALAKIRPYIEIYDERQADGRNSAF